MIENTDLNTINCGNIPNPKYKIRLAPLETPIILGSTSGFFNTVCNNKPLTPRAAPTKIVMIILGKRTSIIAFTLAYSPVKIPIANCPTLAFILPLFAAKNIVLNKSKIRTEKVIAFLFLNIKNLLIYFICLVYHMLFLI